MALMYRVRVVTTGVAGGPAYSNHYAVNPTGGAAGFQNRVATMWSQLAGFMCTPAVITTQGEVAFMDSATGDIQSVVVTTPATVNAQDSTPMLPLSTQLLVRWGTEAFNGGRRVIGRTFIPYLPVATNSDGIPNPSVVGQIQAVVSAYRTANAGEAVIWSKTTGGVGFITASSVSTQFAVLRSRRP